MIVDFALKNYRSFKEEQLFSMNVERGKNHLYDNFADLNEGKLTVLKLAGVYGANAAGKSTLFKAIEALQAIVVETGDLKEGEKIPAYEPYRLSPENLGQPTEFEIEFIEPKGARYRYQVSFTGDEIITESLYAYSTRQKALIFERSADDSWETIKFGGSYKGGSRRIPFFRNNSYLSKAGNSAASSDVMRDIYRYFRGIVTAHPTNRFLHGNYFQKKDRLALVGGVLSYVDTGISSVTSEEQSASQFDWFSDLPEGMRNALLEERRYKYSFWHRSENGDLIEFDEELESSGTQRLFNLLPVLLRCFAQGRVLLMDEIDGHFHPHIVDFILSLFRNRAVNKNNAQLLFTTHDMSLMDPAKFRRDQIWFVEKEEGATRLYSLDEYDKSVVKSNSPFANWYDEGRFGALPKIDYNRIIERFTAAASGDNTENTI